MLHTLEAGAGLLGLAVLAPGEDEQPAEDDHDRSHEPDPGPDAREDHDAEDPQGEKRDRGTCKLQCVTHGASVRLLGSAANLRVALVETST